MIKQYRKTFDSYDKQEDGTVLVKDLPAIFKILGTTISDNESIPIPMQSTRSWVTRSRDLMICSRAQPSISSTSSPSSWRRITRSL